MEKCEGRYNPRPVQLPDEKARAFASGVAGLGTLAAYLATLGGHPYWQDAGLFLAAAKEGAGLVPPGYPVWLLLARPVALLHAALFPAASFARGVHLFDALCGAAAAYLVARTALLFLTPRFGFLDADSPSRAERLTLVSLASGATAGLVAGLGYSLWSQAVNAEAYALNGAFSAALLFVVVRLGMEGPLGPELSARQRRLMVALVVVFGLACGNHPVIVAWLPAMLVLAWLGRASIRRHPRFWLGLFLLQAATGLGPYLFMVHAARTHPGTLFDHVTTLPTFVRHVTGAQWTGEAASYGVDLARFAALPRQLFLELFPVALLGLALGTGRLWRERKLAAVLGAFLAPALLLPLVYVQGGEYDLWLIPVWLLFAAIAGPGLVPLSLRAMLRLRRPFPWLAPVGVGLAAVVPLLVVNGPLDTRRDELGPEDYVRNIANELPRDAIFLAWSDQECSLGLWLQAVAGEREDVAWIPTPMLGAEWFGEWLARREPGVVVPAEVRGKAVDPEEAAARIALANAGKRPVWTTKRPALGLPPPLRWVPAGPLWKLDPKGDAEPEPRDWVSTWHDPRPYDRPQRAHAPLRRPEGVARVRYLDQARLFEEQGWKNLGDWRLAKDDHAGALDAYQRILALDPAQSNPEVLFAMGKALFALDREDEAKGKLEEALAQQPGRGEALLYLAQIEKRRGNGERARGYLKRLKAVDPGLYESSAALLGASGSRGVDSGTGGKPVAR
jgi:hypothetical protein